MNQDTSLEYLPNMLMIGSTAKHIGKTALICNFIKQLSQHYTVIAIKVTPTKMAVTLYSIERIYSSGQNANTDTDRFSQAGAQEVYWIQSSREQLAAVLQKALSSLVYQQSKTVLLIESAGARRFIHPGCFIMLTTAKKSVKPSTSSILPMADITFDTEKVDLSNLRVCFDGTMFTFQE